MDQTHSISLFKTKASSVSAFIYEVQAMDQAFQKTIDLCIAKAPCQNLLSSGAVDPAILAPSPENPDEKKIIAAPNLPDDLYETFSLLGSQHGISLIKENVRRYPGGIDMGFTVMDYAIAETGTLVLNSDSEETRLATMLSEFHVALVPKSKLRETALSMADELKEMTSKPNSYTAFITGASRTADIERVLAIGVHGPLELHIMLLED